MQSSSQILIFLMITHLPCFGQHWITGKVLNNNNHQAIPYANIGVEYSAVGTISNADGSFAILIPSQHEKDSLLISALGFQRQRFSIAYLAKNKDHIIYLKERPVVLETVTVPGKKEKNKSFELGNKSCQGGVLETDTIYAGASIALLIENKSPSYHKELYYPVYLEKARIRIFRNNLNAFKLRVRLYSADSLHKGPGDELLNSSIVISSSMKNGWLEFDLSYLKHKVTGPFYIAFERIMDEHDRNLVAEGFSEFRKRYPHKVKVDTLILDGKPSVRTMINSIDLPGTFIGISNTEYARENFTCYTRKTSFAPWEKVRGILTATVTLSNQVVINTALRKSIE